MATIVEGSLIQDNYKEMIEKANEYLQQPIDKLRGDFDEYSKNCSISLNNMDLHLTTLDSQTALLRQYISQVELENNKLKKGFKVTLGISIISFIISVTSIICYIAL